MPLTFPEYCWSFDGQEYHGREIATENAIAAAIRAAGTQLGRLTVHTARIVDLQEILENEEAGMLLRVAAKALEEINDTLSEHVGGDDPPIPFPAHAPDAIAALIRGIAWATFGPHLRHGIAEETAHVIEITYNPGWGWVIEKPGEWKEPLCKFQVSATRRSPNTDPCPSASIRGSSAASAVTMPSSFRGDIAARAAAQDEDARHWACIECGEKADPNSSKWRWSGDCWEHHHGYPIGHVPARREA